MMDFSDQNYLEPFNSPGIKAAIDIGTNTILLLVADVDNDNVRVLHEEQRTPRIGKGVDQNRVISMEAMERAFLVLIEYRNFIYEQYGVIPVMVTATSAVRDASNKAEFMMLIEEATGYRVRLLSGSEEADCTFRGGLSQLELDSESTYTVIDIGGGSTEIVAGSAATKNLSGVSIDMGSVRFSERFIPDAPASSGALIALKSEVFALLEKNVAKSDGKLVGVAGTATTIAALLQNMHQYDAALLNGYEIKTTDLIALIESMKSMRFDEVLSMHPQLLKGREDIILAGSLILLTIAEYFDKDRITVSTGGLRHGALISTLYS
jgi:exopolyphosphatase / guanosine-5'-triphosphate,3'-diphosphate pyrophosphatase